MGKPSRQALTHEPQLVVYSAACRALAAARTTDEARKIRNDAAMLRAYARQANNKQLELDAVEIRIRAERRVGELIAAQKATVGLAKGRRSDLVPKGNQVPKATLAEAGIDKKLSARAQKLAAVSEKRFETMVTKWRDRVEADGERVTADLLGPSSKLAVHQSSETPEHYTPVSIVELVVACLGAIDIDPCSDADRHIPARRHYTAAENGLTKTWTGRVYMNPPYGREIDGWVAKLCGAHECGDVSQAIALLPARTDTLWFKRLRNYVCCFVEGRLTFIGNADPAPFPSAIFYLGDDIGRFHRHFKSIGDIWQRLEPEMYAE